MNTNDLKSSSIGGVIALTAVQASCVEHNPSALDEFLAKITSKDDQVRGPAWQNAAAYGAAAVPRLAAVLIDQDFEVARSAKRALYLILRHAGRPGAANESKNVQREILKLLTHEAMVVRREALWMLSEIAGEDAVAPMAALLADAEVREDARCALLRLPGKRVTSALKSAMKEAPEMFKPALAEALRQRGRKVTGYPSQRLVPSRRTTVGQPEPGK